MCIKNNLSVSQASFTYIANLLQRKTTFADTCGINTDEQLGIFLLAVATNMSMRRTAERFQYSTSTIYCIYHRVMHYIVDPAIYNAVIRPATANTPLSDVVARNPDFYPYFADCIGAVDGTHIPVSPSDSHKAFVAQSQRLVVTECPCSVRL